MAAGMSGLEHLVLHRIPLGDAGPLHHLRRLGGIALELGSATDLSPLAGLPELRFVEAWQVRGLVDLTALAGLASAPALQQLCITRRLLDLDEVAVLGGHPTLAAASVPVRGRTGESEGRLGLQHVDRAPFTAYGAGVMALSPEGWDGVYLQAEEELPAAADS